MHFRRTGAVLRLAILTAVLTWFAQTVSEAADAVTLRTSIKDHPRRRAHAVNDGATLRCSNSIRGDQPLGRRRNLAAASKRRTRRAHEQ